MFFSPQTRVCTKSHDHTAEPCFRVMYAENMLDQMINYIKGCANYGTTLSSKNKVTMTSEL